MPLAVEDANSDGNQEAFMWTVTDGMVGISSLNVNNLFSTANGISADGTVIVGSSINNDNNIEAFMWTVTDGMQGLDFLDPNNQFPSSEALGISADGSVIVGGSTNSDGNTEAFMWTVTDGIQSIGVLDPNNQFPTSNALGILADGSVIVGGSRNSDDIQEAFMWTVTDGMQGIGVLDPNTQFASSTANGISADGSVIVGVSRNSDIGFEAVMWVVSPTSSSGIVVGTTTVPQFCGLKQLLVSTEPDFTEVFLPIIFDETVDLQVSLEETLRVANTGSGDAVVNADLTTLDDDRQTTDWESLAGDTFPRGNTRSHHLSSQTYSAMTPITDNPFIDVLPGQTDPESTFVDRFLKVRPDVGFMAFGNAGTDLITFTQVLRLEVSCDPAATCPEGEQADNGECVQGDWLVNDQNEGNQETFHEVFDIPPPRTEAALEVSAVLQLDPSTLELIFSKHVTTDSLTNENISIEGVTSTITPQNIMMDLQDVSITTQVLITTNAPLVPGQTYNIVIKNSVQDHSGLSLESDLIFDFLAAVESDYNLSVNNKEISLGEINSAYASTDNQNINKVTFSWIDPDGLPISSQSLDYSNVDLQSPDFTPTRTGIWVVNTSFLVNTYEVQSISDNFSVFSPTSPGQTLVSQHDTNINVNMDGPQVVLPVTGEDLILNIPKGLSEAQIDFRDYVEYDNVFDTSSVTLQRALTIDAQTQTQDISVSFPQDVTISANADWDAIFDISTDLPFNLITAPSDLGQVTTVTQVGDEFESLSFDKAIRIKFSDKAGQKIGFQKPGSQFTEITTQCSDDTQATNDNLPESGSCKINVNADLVVWTMHNTLFATFGSSLLSGTTTGGGGGGGDQTPPNFKSISVQGAKTVQDDGTLGFGEILKKEIKLTNQMPSAVVETGTVFYIKLLLYENSGKEALEHVTLYTNIRGPSSKVSQSDTYIRYNDGKVTLRDVDGVFSNGYISFVERGGDLEVVFELTAQDTMNLSDIIVRAWDSSRNMREAKFVDAIEIVREARFVDAIEIVRGTAQSLEFGGIIDDAKLVMDPEPGVGKKYAIDPEPLISMEVLDDWSGFSSNYVSDSEFLSHIGIDGDEIPSWLKKSKIAKWVRDGMVSQQEFVNALKFLDKKGII